jgi:uncharacterized protein (DUF1697 family)
MAEFRAVLERLGCTEVATYIQSGNAVCRTDLSPEGLAGAVSEAIRLPNGTHPPAMVLGCGALQAALVGNPFPGAEDAPKTLHPFFLAPREAVPDLPPVTPGEAMDVWGSVLYLHTPGGFGTSVLAGKLNRLIGGMATARNLATVRALAAMCREGAP